MQGFPEEIFQGDMQTFPREDPRILESQQKQAQAAKKAQAEEEKQAKAEAVKFAKAMKEAPPPKKPAAAKTSGGGDKSADAKRVELKRRKIKLYFANEKIAKKLSVKEPKTLPKSEEELDDLLAEIESDLHSSGGIKQAGLMYINGCAALENITQVFNPLGWDLRGPKVSFTQTVAANKEQWEELVTEFAISNAEWFMVGPGKRLLLTTIQMIMAVDSANKAATAIPRATASEGLKAEAAEL